jgi:hypothetical protein
MMYNESLKGYQPKPPDPPPRHPEKIIPPKGGTGEIDPNDYTAEKLTGKMSELADRTFQSRLSEQDMKKLDKSIVKEKSEIEQLFEKYNLLVRGCFLQAKESKINVNLDHISAIKIIHPMDSETYDDELSYFEIVVGDETDEYSIIEKQPIEKIEELKKVVNELIAIVTYNKQNPGMEF